MTTLLFLRRFVAEYARNPANLILLVLVPAVFVLTAAGTLAKAAVVLGGTGGPAMQVVSAGWAAGVLSAVGMYFQVRGARATDRRVVLSGLASWRLVTARLATGLVLAGVAAGASLIALAARTSIPEPGRVIAGTMMFALIYLAVGAVVGAVVRSPVNGTVIILFIWIVDVFFGPLFSGPDRLATRWLPTHFLTLWTVDLPTGHAGRIGDLGWAAVWTMGALLVAWTVVVAGTRVSRSRTGGSARPRSQLAGLLKAGLRERRRTPVLALLLVIVPVVFILGAVAITPAKDLAMTLTDHGRAVTETLSMRDTHGGTMAPIAIGSLAALAGLFTILDARTPDRRLVLAGVRIRSLLSARLALIGLSAVLVTLVSLAATATVFRAEQPAVYALGNLLVAAVYALVGVVLGPAFGRVAGVFIAFLAPFLDLGLIQSPMLGQPPGWARLLPGWGPYQVLLDGAFTASFDQIAGLVSTVAWLTALIVAATALFRPAGRRAGTVRNGRPVAGAHPVVVRR